MDNNQTENIRLVKDLGVLEHPTTMRGDKKLRTRYGIYECPICKSHVKQITNHVKTKVKRGKIVTCESCRYTNLTKSNTKHGLCISGNPKHYLYRAFADIKNKCYNKRSKDYKYYGEKGITICDEWLNDVELFATWCIENGWSKGLHIEKDIICERENIYPKIYSPSTVMFVDGSINSRESANRRHHGRNKVK